MTDEAPKPKRKHRRWIIAGVLLSVASLIAWQWPRVDQRLIGNWRIITSEEDFRVRSPLKLTSDGQGEVAISRGNGPGDGYTPHVYQFPWRYQGGTFVVFRANNSRWAFWNRVMTAGYSYSGNPMFLDDDRYAMKVMDDGTMEFRRESDGASQAFLPRRFLIHPIP